MKMIINGKPADSVSGITREIYSPADGAILDTVPVASEEDLELAFEAAREGQKKWGMWLWLFRMLGEQQMPS